MPARKYCFFNAYSISSTFHKSTVLGNVKFARTRAGSVNSLVAKMAPTSEEGLRLSRATILAIGSKNTLWLGVSLHSHRKPVPSISINPSICSITFPRRFTSKAYSTRHCSNSKDRIIKYSRAFPGAKAVESPRRIATHNESRSFRFNLRSLAGTIQPIHHAI